ncbi:MAG: hypothetical protein AAF213_03530 [Pseudomonadota bacterium]
MRLAQILRRDTDETLALEAMGVIAGTSSLEQHAKRQGQAHDGAAALVARIDRFMRRRTASNSQFAGFLRDARKGLAALSAIPSQLGEVIPYPNPEHSTMKTTIDMRRPNPAWGRALERFKSAMGGQAEQLFDQAFGPSVALSAATATASPVQGEQPSLAAKLQHHRTMGR